MSKSHRTHGARKRAGRINVARIAMTTLGVGVMLAGAAQLMLLLSQAERSHAKVPGFERPPAAAALQPAQLSPAALANDAAFIYPAKGRAVDSVWGCAAFDEDQDTPAPESGRQEASVSFGARTPARGLVGYRLVAGEATDTLIPDLDYFQHCMETGQPRQVVERSVRRSTADVPASRWMMDMIDLDVAIAVTAGVQAEPARVVLEVARSAPDASPYVEVLSVREPFGGLWMLDHGATPAGAMSVVGQVYEAPCARDGGAEEGPRFMALPFAPDAVSAGRDLPASDGPRRRWFDLSSDIMAIPAAAPALAWRACSGEACEGGDAFEARNRTAAAFRYCDTAGGGVWRVRADGRLRARGGAGGAGDYVSEFTALAPLEPPGPLTAAPAYRPPRPGGVGLVGRAAEPYAIAAAVTGGARANGWSVRVRLAPPETSVHLIRAVAQDATGRTLGASRWLHVLAFSPHAAAPRAPSGETLVNASANGAATLPNP